jgi:hypothetical protein
MIAARNSGLDTGNKIWASTLPAPADFTEYETCSERSPENTYLTTNGDLVVTPGITVTLFIRAALAYLLWIATKFGNIILDELQGKPLVLQSDVEVMRRDMRACKLTKVRKGTS